MGTSDTLVAAEYKGTVIGATIGYSAFLLAVGGLTYGVVKKTHKRCMTISYVILLSIVAISFFAIAFVGPKVRGM